MKRPQMKQVQHQFLPLPGTVRIELRAVVRPDKADYWLEMSATDISKKTLVWERAVYFPRSTHGMSSMLAELHDMLVHLEDHMNVDVAPLQVELPIDHDF